jgi:hypothetical protein
MAGNLVGRLMGGLLLLSGCQGTAALTDFRAQMLA